MAFQGDSIFWVDTEKVVPNPFQPRREFDQNKLQELSESIRMYGVLQPLTVTRSEVQRDDGTFYTEYELIAGERRLRASRLAGVAQVPVIIREGEQNEQEKLELAIIENLQREDLNAIDRALAFQQLAEQFELSHTQVAQKVGRSREYVSNSIRLLALPEHMRLALQRGELGEGHARTLLMLTDRPQEQETIFREILLKKMSVREVERIVRKIATDKVRKKQHSDIGDHLIEIEKEFTETLGTRVQIQKTEFGGKLTIDYFSEEDLSAILKRMQAEAPNGQVPTAAAAMAVMAAATPLVDTTDKTGEPSVQEVHQESVHDAAEKNTESIQQDQDPQRVEAESPPSEQGVVSDATHQAGPIASREFTAPQVSPGVKPEPQVQFDPQSHAEHVPEPEPQPALENIVQTEPDINHMSHTAAQPQPAPVPQVADNQPQTPAPQEPVHAAPMMTTPQTAKEQPPAPVMESDVTPGSSTDLPVQRFFHNAFGFNRSVPESKPVESVAPLKAESAEQPPVNNLPDDTADQQTESQTHEVEPEKPKDESEDIYSIRNFSI